MSLTIRTISIYYGLLIIVIIYWSTVHSLWSDIQLTGFTNSHDGVVITDLKVNRMNKTTYAASGLIYITKDLSEGYDVGMTTYYSKIGNNQYVKMPFNYGTSFCSFSDVDRFKRFYKLLRECSDFPKEVEGQPICHVFSKGNYTITNFPMDPINQVFQTGLYKFEFVILKSGSFDDISRFVIHVKLT